MIAKEFFFSSTSSATAAIGVAAVGAAGYWFIFKYDSTPLETRGRSDERVKLDAMERRARRKQRASLFYFGIASVSLVGFSVMLYRYNLWFDRVALTVNALLAVQSCYAMRDASGEIKEIFLKKNALSEHSPLPLKKKNECL